MGRARDGKERQMPLFMDVHNIEGGVSAAEFDGAAEPPGIQPAGTYGELSPGTRTPVS